MSGWTPESGLTVAQFNRQRDIERERRSRERLAEIFSEMARKEDERNGKQRSEQT